MGEPELIDWVIENANSQGEDFNDGDIRPGWLTAEWLEDEPGRLLVTYEDPDHEVRIAKYKIERISRHD